MEMFHELEDHQQQQQDISQFLACSILDDPCLFLQLECFHTQTWGSMYYSFFSWLDIYQLLRGGLFYGIYVRDIENGWVILAK